MVLVHELVPKLVPEREVVLGHAHEEWLDGVSGKRRNLGKRTSLIGMGMAWVVSSPV